MPSVFQNHTSAVFQWGTVEEWEFGLQRLIELPADRKQSEQYYLVKTLARCPRQEEKVEQYCNSFFTPGLYSKNTGMTVE
jgi:hypothetical protein